MKLHLIFFFLLLQVNLNAQDVKRLCETTEMNRRALLENPDAIRALEELNEFTTEYEQQPNHTRQVYIIPVVFHVVHNYGPENISKAQIEDCIRVINEDFRKMNSDTSVIIPEFKGIAADCEIEFRLAKIDPDGNCTDGIERVVSPLTYNANEETKMAVPAWPRNKYLNVWTVASIESGAAGYSYYPSSVSGSWGEDLDGILLLSSYVGSIGTSVELRKRTLTHEAGHYLNLMHPWGNSNDPGLQSNCNDDDQVNDTPNTIGHTSCNLYAVTCSTLDNVQNYMDYSYCGNMFTYGQKTRMQAALNSSVSGRNNLWTPQNLAATGTADGYSAPPCIPVADFTGNPVSGCEGYSVTYKDLSWNSDSINTYNWSFPGGNPSVSSDRNPVVVYSSPGRYDVTLEAGNSSGNGILVKQNYVNVVDLSSGISIPLNESFESASFPNTAIQTDSWMISKTGTQGWQRVTTAAYDGTASLSVFNPGNNPGDVTELISPNINSDSLGPYANLVFMVAYAQQNEESSDMIRVWLSTDCGKTWKIRFSRTGAALATNGGSYVSSFIPSTSQWREEIVPLGIFSDYSDIMLKFVCISGNGNRVYIDRIRLDEHTDVPQNDFTSLYKPALYPNPGSGVAMVEWFSPAAETVKLNISDLSGRIVLTSEVEAEEGYNQASVDRTELPAGFYLLKLQTEKGETFLRLVKN
jgi:PKD repeat protein